MVKAALRGRYDVQRELGAGGMATVYLARDARHDRDVAIKVLNAELAESLGRDRFEREIKLAARLTHPHILPLFDSGDAHGLLFYVMPVMAGQTLRDRIVDGGPMAVEDAVRIATEVADALDYAHRHDIVHRDIKPENILLHEGHAIVADFGIGKALAAASSSTSASFTQIGMAVGTPAYMSPEQATGEAVDGRSDLFALGCTLYEMLTGAPPFTGASAQAVIARRFTHTPPAVTAQRPAVPESLSRTVEKLLEKAPEDRLTSGAHVVRALKGEVVLEAKREVPSVAVLPFANMSADADNAFFSDGITDDIITALGKLPGLKVAARASAFSFRGADVDLAAVGEKLGVRHVLQGSVRRAGNRVRVTAQLMTARDGTQVWGERWDRDLDDIFAIQDEIARAIVAELEVRLGTAQAAAPLVVRPTQDMEAYELFLLGRDALRRRTRSGLARAIDLFAKATERDPRFLGPVSGTIEAYSVMGNFGYMSMAESRARAGDAIVEAERLGLGGAQRDALLAYRESQSSEGWFEAGLLLRQHFVNGSRDPFLVAYYGVWCAMLGDAVGAAVAIARAREVDPLSAWTIAQCALAQLAGGELAAALPLAETATRLDPTHAYTSAVHTVALSRNGRHEEAIARGLQCAALFEQAPFGRGLVAFALAGAGRVAEAEALADEIWAEDSVHVIGNLYATLRLGGVRLERVLRLAVEVGVSPIAIAGPMRPDLDRWLDDATFGPLMRELPFFRGLAKARAAGYA
jgi:serine/threonine-protein kinase